MLDDLRNLTSKINDFDKLNAGDKIDFFAYYILVENKLHEFQTAQILEAFRYLKIIPYSNIPQYLKSNSNIARPKKKKVKYIKSKNGFQLEASFEKELKSKIIEVEIPFINFSINAENLEWKPSDIPFLNNKIRQNANFFSKLYFLLYHLENSLRKFLLKRLIAILGINWEQEILQKVDLSKAQSIRKEISLSEMLPERGENIFYYCMWDDYGKVIKSYPTIFQIQKEADEVLAHLNSLSKIRNAIAHNAATIPKDYQEELTVFLKKYIKIMGKNDS